MPYLAEKCPLIRRAYYAGMHAAEGLAARHMVRHGDMLAWQCGKREYVSNPVAARQVHSTIVFIAAAGIAAPAEIAEIPGGLPAFEAGILAEIEAELGSIGEADYMRG